MNGMKNRLNLLHLRLLALFGAFALAVASFIAYLHDETAGLYCAAILLCYLVFLLALFLISRKSALQEGAGESLSNLTIDFLSKLGSPVLLISDEDTVAWYNRAFSELDGGVRYGAPCSAVLDGVLTLDRIKAKYPKLPMMLCSGGSGRIDYEALQYFTEFWASDNTDPIQRLFIQYGYSFFYPAKSMSAHVTTWNKNASIKFRTDVAMMGKLGFDIKLSDMSGDDLTYCQGAVKNYKRLRPAIMEGDLYRLVSPYDGTRSHAANQFVSKDKNKAVVFAFDVYPGYGEKILPVRLEGLDAGKQYRVKEINLMPNQGSSLEGNDRVFSGDYLMKVGLNLLTGNKLYSRVVEITAE